MAFDEEEFEWMPDMSVGYGVCEDRLFYIVKGCMILFLWKPIFNQKNERKKGEQKC